MAKIDDIQKLRPELLDKSTAELERQMTELQMALDHKKAEAERKEVAALVDEVNSVQEAVSKGLAFLHENRLLAESVISAYTTAGGSFAPHLKHRPVDADRMLSIKAQIKAEAEGKTVKKRRARAPKG